MILYAVTLTEIDFRYDVFNGVTVFPFRSVQEAVDRFVQLVEAHPYQYVNAHSMDLETGESMEVTLAELVATAKASTGN